MNAYLSMLVFSPLFIGLFLLFVRKKENVIGITATLFPFLIALIFFYRYKIQGGTTFSERWPWLPFRSDVLHKDPAFLIDYELEMDGVSLSFVLLSVFLTSVCATLSWQIERNRKQFIFFLILLETGMLGLFVAANLFLFFIFFELTVICFYFLAGTFGGEGKEKAAYHFFMYNITGSAFLLFAIVVLFVQTGTVNIEQIQHLLQTDSVEMNGIWKWVLVFSILIAFAIKMPIFPFHQWMVNIHTIGHPAIVIVHSGVLLKIATYGFLRFGIGFFPNEWDKMSGMLILFALINVFYGAFLAMGEKDLRRIWAYGSISHMGLVFLGLAIGSKIGIQGALFHTVSHGIVSGLLFLFVAIIFNRFETTDLQKLSDLRRVSPFAVFILFVGGIASFGLPATSGFIGEFTILFAAFDHHPSLGVLAAGAIILTTTYILRAILSISYERHPITDGGTGKWAKQISYPVYEWFPAILFVGLLIGLGVYPQWLMELFKDIGTKFL